MKCLCENVTRKYSRASGRKTVFNFSIEFQFNMDAVVSVTLCK